MSVSLDPTYYEKHLQSASQSSGEEKPQQLRLLRDAIKAFESHCVGNWDVPFYTVKRVRALIPEVEAGINRLMAAKRTKQGG